jgi:exodeoxyribonuclease VII large subunit
MSEKTDDKVIYSLLEVTKSIQKTLSERYTSSFWVKAEMNKLNPHPPSGHCYPELVEKKNGRIIAEIGSNLWKEDYQRINNNFLRVLKEPLKNGIGILFNAKIAYDPVYGLRLRILDIDPSYSLGELEREKQETIDKLRRAGIYDTNRSLKMPLLPKRLAIISVETSKGYSDFIKTIENNPWGYRFFHMLFPAILQGERSVNSILAQLRRIGRILPHFDAVAIIRGGGGEVGLTSYNDYTLARAIALFPIPVITGIGHSTNETVAEMIAFRNAITPTDLADYLLQQFHNFAVPVQNAVDTVLAQSKRIIKDERSQFLHTVKYFRSVTGSLLQKKEHEMQTAIRYLHQGARQAVQAGWRDTAQLAAALADKTGSFLLQENRELGYLEKTVALLDPDKVLKRGYSITMKNGRLVNSVTGLREGDLLTTLFSDGSVISAIGPIPAAAPEPAANLRQTGYPEAAANPVPAADLKQTGDPDPEPTGNPKPTGDRDPAVNPEQTVNPEPKNNNDL